MNRKTLSLNGIAAGLSAFLVAILAVFLAFTDNASAQESRTITMTGDSRQITWTRDFTGTVDLFVIWGTTSYPSQTLSWTGNVASLIPPTGCSSLWFTVPATITLNSDFVSLGNDWYRFPGPIPRSVTLSGYRSHVLFTKSYTGNVAGDNIVTLGSAGYPTRTLAWAGNTATLTDTGGALTFHYYIAAASVIATGNIHPIDHEGWYRMDPFRVVIPLVLRQ